jgi:hypothetical protein
MIDERRLMIGERAVPRRLDKSGFNWFEFILVFMGMRDWESKIWFDLVGLGLIRLDWV